MSITLDFILLFILVVIPGLIFKRFYFSGEFSKQFNSKDTVYKSIFYSIIPGIIIQIIAYWLYLVLRSPTFLHADLFCIFNELFAPTTSYSEVTKNFVEEEIHFFLLHEINVFILSAFLGYICYSLIRIFKLDIRFKILRFKNQWYYVFSGEIRSFRKFKHAAYLSINHPKESNKYKYFPPRVDILVQGEGTPILYTGLVIDYDLDSENINNIERLYLLGAHKYPITNQGDNLETDHENLETNQKTPINGDVFIIKGDKIINMNLTFIPSPERDNDHESTSRKSFKFVVYHIGFYLNILIFIYLTFINTPFINAVLPTLTEALKNHNWFERLFLSIIINFIISLLMPNEQIIKTETTIDTTTEVASESTQTTDKIKYTYSFKAFLLEFVIGLVLAIIYYFTIFK